VPKAPAYAGSGLRASEIGPFHCSFYSALSSMREEICRLVVLIVRDMLCISAVEIP